MIGNPNQPSENRLVFLSPPLEDDLRISGTPVINLTASSSLHEAYFGAILVEYGPSTQNDRSGDGIRQTTLPEECYGESSQYDDGCYRPIAYRPIDVTQWRVTKGILDGQNRNSITTAEPMTPGQLHEISFPLLPNDYVFAAGNQIGVVIVGSYRSYSAQRIFSRPTITVNTKVSHIVRDRESSVATSSQSCAVAPVPGRRSTGTAPSSAAGQTFMDSVTPPTSTRFENVTP